jgi:hypothetical protein
MSNREATRVSRNIRRSPLEIEKAIRAFSANARSFVMSREEAIKKYKDKWIAVHKGEVVVVADTLPDLVRQVSETGYLPNEILYHRVDSLDKVFIL